MSTNRPNGNGWGFSGAAALQQASIEQAKAKEKRERAGILRFRLKEGESAEVIILDSSIHETIAFYEHEITPGGNWKDTYYEISPKPAAEDPLEIYPVVNGQTSTPYFVQFYTILDLRPYTTKDGQVVPYSRKILPVKQSQINEFAGLAEKAVKKWGTLRGTHFKLERLAQGGKFSTRIGTIQTLDSMEIEHMTDDQLIARFGHPAITNKEGKVFMEANEKLLPFDYFKIFKQPDPAELRKKYGIGAPMGSAQEDAEVWGSAVSSGLAAAGPANPQQVPPVANTSSGDSGEDEPDLLEFA